MVKTSMNAQLQYIRNCDFSPFEIVSKSTRIRPVYSHSNEIFNIGKAVSMQR